ncbi:hypothetical protein AMTR_s00067p00158200 [Amborella trichopoda]|uniref:PGG domain-containing protein n=1 Tax=Amborella trichopoda TaxID=13333 RepID=U5DBT3_AMBTC|nr:hypothetical protein AMTR_s00067p00158200 [Amborella trichopoda]
MCLLTLVVSIPALRPPACNSNNQDCTAGFALPAYTFQIGIFYCTQYVLAVGTGGTKPNNSTMGADQFDESHPKERKQKLSFFNWWMFRLLVSVCVIIVGTMFYRHKLPSGSPFTSMLRALVEASQKWDVKAPDDSKEIHELDAAYYAMKGSCRIDLTPTLRFLRT